MVRGAEGAHEGVLVHELDDNQRGRLGHLGRVTIDTDTPDKNGLIPDGSQGLGD